MIRIPYDFHIHSCLSPCGDNESTPANIVGMAALIGLEAIAIADHNTCLNVPAAIEAAEEFGITVLPAMELTTSEEVHVLCYFPDAADALSFSDYVEKHSMYVQNKPEFFGEQLICDSEDNVTGSIDRLLHTASDISFDNVADVLKDFNGLMVPAHINKSTTSVLSNLGFIPDDSKFTAVEIQTEDKITELRRQHPHVDKCHILTSSDAHYLQDISEPTHFLHADDNTPQSIIRALRSYL